MYLSVKWNDTQVKNNMCKIVEIVVFIRLHIFMWKNWVGLSVF